MSPLHLDPQSFLKFLEDLLAGHGTGCCKHCHKPNRLSADGRAALYMPNNANVPVTRRSTADENAVNVNATTVDKANATFTAADTNDDDDAYTTESPPILIANEARPHKNCLIKPTCSKHSGRDILNHTHTDEGYRHFLIGNTASKNWLEHEPPAPDLYGECPHTSGYEQNVKGFDEAFLERIERYWLEHSLVPPNEHKDCRCAPVGAWQIAQRRAQRQEEEIARRLKL
ncbi:MAG TPA: hypothetical protein V6C89_17945 [Drouetiella sp.]